MNLFSPLDAVKGIGEKRKKLFSEKGMETLLDLLFFFPRGFKDYSRKITIAESLEHPGLCPVTVMTKPSVAYFGKRLNLVRCKVSDGETEAGLQFFNMPFMVRNMEKGDAIFLYGQAKTQDDKITFTNPGFERKNEFIGQYPFVPVYPQIPGISGRMVMNAVAAILDALTDEPDYMTDGFKRAFNLPDLYPAHRALHFPERLEDHSAALKRFSIEELLVFLSMLKEQLPAKKENAVRLTITPPQKSAFDKALGFAPTPAQARVMEEIARDLSSGLVMNRLIQGDVGCGKTAVAFYAMLMNYANGYQSVMMAPTEVLARQHNAKDSE